MWRALTAEQVRALEQRAVDSGTGLDVLMQSAGQALAAQVDARVPAGDIAVLTGPGNNGGDGWVAAERLHAAGRSVRVLAMRPPDELRAEARTAAESAVAAGVDWVHADTDGVTSAAAQASVVVDALLGIGASVPLREPAKSWCRAARDSGTAVISADVPTGVDSDTGQADEDAILAECTVTFIQPKLGLVTYPGASHAGEIVVADIGVDPATTGTDAPAIWSTEEYAELIPLPAPTAHKNNRGRVLVVAGSQRYPGAAVLAVRGAMRAGAGYVTLATPDPAVAAAHAHLLSAPVIGVGADATGAFTAESAERVLELAAEYDAVALGPGLTLTRDTRELVFHLVTALDTPLVIDADGLNALAGDTALLQRRTAATVLTPHPGELARLLGRSVSEVQADRVSSCQELARTGSTVVLKGAGTVVARGSEAVIVTSGTPALATAGTGDVLTGVVASLLAQGLAPMQAAALGAYLHGRAGECAAADLTPVCVTAEDVPEYLPSAVGALLNNW